MKNFRNLELGLTLILLSATAILSILAYIMWYRLTFFVDSFLFIHWLSIVATIFIAVATPLHYILKRKRSQKSKIILKIHVLGNLFAFLLISIHFSQNLGRLSGALQRLGTGFVLYLLLSFIMATGILERYKTSGKLPRYVKIIHKYAVVMLYLVITLHVLEGFNIL